MEVEIRLEPGRKEPRAVIYAGADTPELQELAQRLSGVFLGPVPAFRGERAVLLEPGEVYRFYTDGKGCPPRRRPGSTPSACGCMSRRSGWSAGGFSGCPTRSW